jgi:anaerobic magnesium-protoporphyrin IX monomethyl ester cyclase
MNTDLVIINPPNRKAIYQVLADKLAAIEPPVWAGLLATFIRRRGFSVEVIDAEAEDFSAQQVAEIVVRWKPHLTVVVAYGHQPSASTQTMPGAGMVCAALKYKNPGLKVLLLGGHVAALPEQTLREEMADFVCTGEGPYTVLDLLQSLQHGVKNFIGVRDLCYRENTGICKTNPAPLVKDLDTEMPGVAWDLLPMAKYRAYNWLCYGYAELQPYAALYTTLGCPYRCTFCCIQAPFKGGEAAMGMQAEVNSYRFWSPKTVVDQIGVLVERYGVKHLKIADEMFVLNPRHVEAICDGIIERGYKLNIWAYARVDTVKPKMLEKLKRAGFNWLCFGIESANSRVRGDVDKDFQQEEVYRTIYRVKAAGINIAGNFMFGLPEDDHSTMQETLALALDLNCEYTNVYAAQAYPGSELYRTAIKNGWELPKSWSGYSQHAVDTLPLRTKYLTAAEVLRFRDAAFERCATNPRYIDMMTAKFGEATARGIREMASHKLEREILSAGPARENT